VLSKFVYRGSGSVAPHHEIYLAEFTASIFNLCKIFNVTKTHISGLQGAPDFLHALVLVEG